MMRSTRSLVSLTRRAWLQASNNASRRLSSAAAATKIPASSINVVKSPYPDIEIPTYSVDEFVWRNFDDHMDKTAVVSLVSNFG